MMKTSLLTLNLSDSPPALSSEGVPHMPAAVEHIVEVMNEPEEAMSDECFESEGFIKFQSTIDDLLLAASTASTMFNILVIYCAFKLLKKKSIETSMHVFIINMTLGDLLLTGNWLGLAVSGLSLTLLNVDKLFFFCWPYQYMKTMSIRLAAILCIAIWAISLGFVSYVWLLGIVYVEADCMLQMADSQKHYYEVFMILFCVLPVTSSLVVSTFLFRLIKQKQGAPASLPGSSHPEMKREFKHKTKSLVFIFATTLWTSFSLLPYRVFNICRIHLLDWHRIDCHQREMMNWLAWILIYLLTLNPIVNPVITAMVYTPYRKALRKLLISVPIGNRLQTYTQRTNTEATTYLSGISGGRRKTRDSDRSTDNQQEPYGRLPNRRFNSFRLPKCSNLKLLRKKAGSAGDEDSPRNSNQSSSNNHITYSSDSRKQSDSKSNVTPSSTSTFSKGQQLHYAAVLEANATNAAAKRQQGRDLCSETTSDSIEMKFIDEYGIDRQQGSESAVVLSGSEEPEERGSDSSGTSKQGRRRNITFQTLENSFTR